MMLSSAIRENGASSGPGVLATYGYDNLGRRTSVARGNGVVTAYDYDAALRLEEIAHNLAGTGSDQTLNFTYNAAGQIIGRAGANASYEFTPAAPGTTVYADNGLNQYTSIGGANQSYDGRGNLTTGSFGYDIFNRLISGPNSAALSYDPLGRLYETSASGVDAVRFLYDGATIIGEYDDEDELLRRYVHGPAIDEPIVWYEGEDSSDRRWLAADQLGSVIAITDGAGDALDINSYGEYGIPGGANAGRFQYTGQAWLPEVALYHYKARAYSAELGRFLQTDPIGFAGGMNLYAYVGNDPVNWRDPTGLDHDDCVGSYYECHGDIVVTLFGSLTISTGAHNDLTTLEVQLNPLGELPPIDELPYPERSQCEGLQQAYRNELLRDALSVNASNSVGAWWAGVYTGGFARLGSWVGRTLGVAGGEAVGAGGLITEVIEEPSQATWDEIARKATFERGRIAERMALIGCLG